jgi:hypothetical protein
VNNVALLDFIKNRNAARQQSVAQTQQQKPETAKEMYSRQDAQKTTSNAVDRMPPEQLAKVDEIKARMEKATQHVGQNAAAPQQSSGEEPGNRQAMRQNMVSQDKTAPSMSPTSAQAGKPESEKAPARTPQKSSQRPHTVARRPPSWER